MITYKKSTDISWSTQTGTRSGNPGEYPFKTQLSRGAGVVSKANRRRFWPPIKDTCVPSHLIEAGFPEKETTPEQYDKTNRFKDITTVFVIGTFFMVHGNCCCGGYFFFRKTFSHSLAQHVECVREHIFSFLFFFFCFTGHHSVLESTPWR